MNAEMISTKTNAKALADSAAEKLNGGVVGVAVQRCSRINLGIFFDGTGNSRNLVGKKQLFGGDYIDSYHTNIDLLQRVYFEGTYESTGCNIHCSSIYLPGIGCSDSEVDIYGMITGLGAFGVPRRVHEGIDQAIEKLRTLSNGEPQIEVLIDVFGFSRGAAGARYFCNLVKKQGALNGPWGRPEIRFLGLFDTVGSIGIPGDDSEPWVEIETPPLETVCDLSMPNGRYIYHIVSEDEFRRNFPLTKTNKGVTVAMPGVHSDVGGGYANERVSSNYKDSKYTSATRTIENKWLGGDDILVWLDMKSSAVHEERPWNFIWNAEPGLSLVPLHAMHHFATATASVPLKSIDIPFPPDLNDLYEALIMQRGLPENRKKEIRLKYGHFSVQNSIGHGPEESGERRSFSS